MFQKIWSAIWNFQDLNKEDQLMSSKEHVQAIFRPALREIAKLEGI